MRQIILLLIVISIAFLPAVILGQTIHQAAAGVDQISAAVASANEGDIIELTSDGGLYTETVGLVVDKALTIRAAEGLVSKPVLVTDDSLTIIMISGDFTLKGIYLDGSLGAHPTAFGIMVANGTMGYHLTIENCEIWDLGTPSEQGSAINGVESSSWVTQAEEVVVIDCMFGRMEGEIIRFTRSPDGVPQPGPLMDLYVYGSTFWGSQVDEAIYVITDDDGSSGVDDNDPLFFIDHCTFVYAGVKGIYPKYIGGAIIQNSIITDGEQYACRIYGVNSGIFNLLWYNCPDGISFYAGAEESQGVNVMNVDPLFVDPDYLTSGNFTLSANSPAVGQADEGKTLGDPRWWPGASSVEMTSTKTTPANFQLYQNYPNPFNPTTTIGFDVVEAGHVTLTIYNIVGQEMATLVNQHMATGFHSVEWSIDEFSTGGIYFYRISVNDNNQVRKMILLK